MPRGVEPAVPSTEVREGEPERCSGRSGASLQLQPWGLCPALKPCAGQGGCCLHSGSACNRHRHHGLTAEQGGTVVTPRCRVAQDRQWGCMPWVGVSHSCPSPGGLSSARGREGRQHERWDGYGALGLELDPFEVWGERSLPAGTGDAALGQPWSIQPWCWVSQERGETQRDPCNVPRPPPAAELPWMRQSSPHLDDFW